MGFEGAPEESRRGSHEPVVEPYEFFPESTAKEIMQKATCPRCGEPTRGAMARSDIWEGDRLIVVEDIPAHMCDKCVEQFYSEPVTEALRMLLQEGLETAKPKREMVVPVYSLQGRVKQPQGDFVWAED